MVADFVRDGLGAWWAPGLAFLAGVVSFASPCVFPLVPGYLSFVSGGVEAVAEPASGRRRSLLPILAFVGGFATVFTLLGLAFRSVQPLLTSTAGQVVSGLTIVLFGVVMLLYAFERGPMGMYAERRPFLEKVKPGPAWAYPLGAAFAVGWTPCIGPVLAGILTLAVAQSTSVRAGLLMLFYSLGLGLPFLLVGLGLSRLMRAVDVIKRNYRWIAGVSGAIMVTIGVLVATGLWTRLLAPLTRLINRFTPPL
jgi:cytochrome c-type biogenesis protein